MRFHFFVNANYGFLTVSSKLSQLCYGSDPQNHRQQYGNWKLCSGSWATTSLFLDWGLIFLFSIGKMCSTNRKCWIKRSGRLPAWVGWISLEPGGLHRLYYRGQLQNWTCCQTIPQRWPIPPSPTHSPDPSPCPSTCWCEAAVTAKEQEATHAYQRWPTDGPVCAYTASSLYGVFACCQVWQSLSVIGYRDSLTFVICSSSSYTNLYYSHCLEIAWAT